MQAAERLVPEPSPFEVEFSIEELKIYESSCTDQIPAELIQAGGNTLRPEIHRPINCI
jgi:hypothetical protein